MKAIFYLSIVFFILFELANVYFIMPMPGSQELDSIDLAYFLYSRRWFFRCLLGGVAALTLLRSHWKHLWIPACLLAAAAIVIYMANFRMAADHMFLQAGNLRLKTAADNQVGADRLILGINYRDQARAYPIQFLGYHHQVVDTIAGKAVIVTYCTVCRTGRVYEPVVNGKTEKFRLVGMDHYNAMLEDQTTKSWWRQATGEAVAGDLKGQLLPEFASVQTSLQQWLSLYPHSLIMQADENFQVQYDSMSNYEYGRLSGRLTRRDTTSWQEKSWVVGISLGDASKAYDWITFEDAGIIHDVIGTQPVVLVLAGDKKSFFAFERVNAGQEFELVRDSLSSGGQRYDLGGRSLDPATADLKKINAYQEYWHSWRTFHPGTEVYQ